MLVYRGDLELNVVRCAVHVTASHHNHAADPEA
jgi:hypothetical protein